MKEFIRGNETTWRLMFHGASLYFYFKLIYPFVTSGNVVFLDRMIIVWYVILHVGFVVLILLQDLIDLTKWIHHFNFEYFKSFNNLLFISLVFPFGLYLTTIHWILHLYNENLVYPSFLQVTLSPWLSMGIHVAILLVVLFEITITRFTYRDNNYKALFVLFAFFFCYILYLFQSYVEYGFWIYPIVHLIPDKMLPLTIIGITAQLVTCYFVGMTITSFIHGTETPTTTNQINSRPHRCNLLPKIYNIFAKKPPDTSSATHTRHSATDITPAYQSSQNSIESSTSTFLWQNAPILYNCAFKPTRDQNESPHQRKTANRHGVLARECNRNLKPSRILKKMAELIFPQFLESSKPPDEVVPINDTKKSNLRDFVNTSTTNNIWHVNNTNTNTAGDSDYTQNIEEPQHVDNTETNKFREEFPDSLNPASQYHQHSSLPKLVTFKDYANADQHTPIVNFYSELPANSTRQVKFADQTNLDIGDSEVTAFRETLSRPVFFTSRNPIYEEPNNLDSSSISGPLHQQSTEPNSVNGKHHRVDQSSQKPIPNNYLPDIKPNETRKRKNTKINDGDRMTICFVLCDDKL